MERTKKRPLPMGQISVGGAFAGGMILVFLSFLVFIRYVNLLSALSAFGGLLSYVFLYTIWLKPRTDQNIVIGGIAGCVGPLIGYAATTNSLPLPAWILFCIIFFWTPAHFWALAIFLKEDYGTANFPMMPVLTWNICNHNPDLFLYYLVCSVLHLFLFCNRSNRSALFDHNFCSLSVYGVSGT